MAKGVSSPVLQMISQVALDQRVRQLSDRDLLQRFDRQRDEAAFHAFLVRHGPMVLEVCRGVLGNDAGAEDAFQATFLVLARKAASIRKKASVGSWLHGVAYRTACKARTQLATRQKKEARAPARTISEPDDLSWREVRQVLHEELMSMPERYRVPLVTCYLEGKTQDESAVQLGLAKTTLKDRLERGRSMLRARLVRRGLGPAAVLLALAWPSATALACLSESLVASTIKAACLFAAAKTVTAAASARAAMLAEGVMKAMFLTKMKNALVVTVTVLGLGAGVGLMSGVSQNAATAQEGKDKPAPTEAVKDGVQAAKLTESKPVVVQEDAQVRTVAWSSNGKILATIGIVYESVEFRDGGGQLTDSGGVIPHSTIKLWDATTGKLKRSLGEEKDTLINAIAFSADGKTAAISTSKHVLTNEPKNPIKFETEVRVMDAETWALQHTVKTDGFASALAFSPDGTSLALGGKSGDKAFVRLWDVQKQKMMGRTEGGGYRVHCLAFSVDGKQLATGDENGEVRLFDGRTGAARRDFVGHGPLRSGGEQCVTGVGFSPDGKTLVSGSRNKTLKLWDVETGELLRNLKNSTSRVSALAFSPDGKLFATAGSAADSGVQGPFEVVLWDTKTGRPKAVFPEQPTVPVNSLAFSPDGSTLAIGGGEGFNSKVNTESGRANTPGEFTLWRPLPTGAVNFRVEELIQELNSDEFQKRAQATKALKALGKEIVPQLEAALKGNESAEVRSRLEQLLAPHRPPTDLRKLHGGWTLEEMEIRGKKLTGKDMIYPFDSGDVALKESLKLFIDGENIHKLRLIPADQVKDAHDRLGGVKLQSGVRQPSEGDFLLNETKKPKQITMAWMVMYWASIYKVEDDNLTLCFNPKTCIRPDEFRTAADTENRVIFVFKRAKKNEDIKAPEQGAKRPKKLARVPDPPPELQRELSAFDDYRHGSEEKFAELERKAEELLKKYTARDDQARIYFELAHVAAQSVIDKHVQRVRRFARRSLDLSRDPIQRSVLYSYLGSAAEVEAEKTFEDRRRQAALELLAGYAEMLAQELPAKAPELPVVEKLGGEGDAPDPVAAAQARARHAAQMAARREAEFIRELVDRRDMLANQLRWLYHPDPRIHGRTPEGPEQLRALAAKVLNDSKAVEALLTRVTEP